MNSAIDIENALAGYLVNLGFTAMAMPYVETELPNVCVTRVGGQHSDMVIDRHSVHLDIRATTWGEANVIAQIITAALRRMEGDIIDDEPVYSVDANLPYSNPDPANPRTPRVTISATINTRSYPFVFSPPIPIL